MDHGDGWTTQYSHMMKGSIKVRKGDKVKTGEILGMIGLSGNTEFPHLDFSARKDNRPIDPFNPEALPCGTAKNTLWADEAIKKLVYQPTGLLISGFAAVPPIQETAENGGYTTKIIPASSGSLVFWAQLFGLRKNDQLRLEIVSPDRQMLSSNVKAIPGDKALWFAFNGKKRKDGSWPKGIYKGVVKLDRDGSTIIYETKEIEVQ